MGQDLKLDHYKRTVPKNGLLNPALRANPEPNPRHIRPMAKPKGNFRNLGL